MTPENLEMVKEGEVENMLPSRLSLRAPLPGQGGRKRDASLLGSGDLMALIMPMRGRSSLRIRTLKRILRIPKKAAPEKMLLAERSRSLLSPIQKGRRT